MRLGCCMPDRLVGLQHLREIVGRGALCKNVPELHHYIVYLINPSILNAALSEGIASAISVTYCY